MPPIQQERPSADWSCREVLDARVVHPSGKSQCDFCGTRIRWIHVLEHDDYDRAVEAGCCCAARLCFEYDAEGEEREVKNRTGRMARFVDLKRWRRSRTNPENVWRFVRTPDGDKVRATVYLKDGSYGICIAAQKTNDRYFHSERYATQREAMSIAFGLVERLKDEDSG